MMNVQQIYTGCLAQGAYYIESQGEVAIIDPLREVDQYIRKAGTSKIKYVFETHFHADFVSGHIDLARKSGGRIIYGPGAETGFDAHIAKDGEEFKLGDLTIRAIHTPGHTLESTCYLLIDAIGKPFCLFSGDTLFIGDVGRPDLAIKSDLTDKDLAGMLFDSLRNKIMPLPDDVIVYPAHGAGSACGKNMSKDTWDTLGHQKESNYALRNISREQFIEEVLDGIAPAPQYFPKNAMMNKSGYESIDSVLSKGAHALSPEAFEQAAEEGALVLDIRKPQEFAAGHIPRSIFIGIDGQFAVWVGALITDLKQPIILIAPPGREEEAVTRLARVGYDNAIGYLAGGFDAWKASEREIDSVDSIPAEDFAARLKIEAKIPVLDVRKEGEYRAQHINEAFNRPLNFINDWMDAVNPDTHYHIHCAGGYRSMIAASILKARGINKITDIQGGFGEIMKTDVPQTDFVCQSKLTKPAALN